MKGKLRVDDKNLQLVMERKFSIASRVVGSEEYDLLQRAKKDYPSYTVVNRHITTNPEKQIYKHLTYDYMYKYISKHPHAEERKAELDEIILRAECHIRRYPNVKKWFLKAYPDLSDFTPEQYAIESQKAIETHPNHILGVDTAA